jgi:hypothetical protein
MAAHCLGVQLERWPKTLLMPPMRMSSAMVQKGVYQEWKSEIRSLNLSAVKLTIIQVTKLLLYREFFE